MGSSHTIEYPVILKRDDNDTVMATFPDVPGAVTYGEDEDEALAYAIDALTVMISAMMDDNEEIPVPKKAKRGQPTVALAPLAASKVMLYGRMRTLGVSKAELARKLGGKNPTHVTRLLNVLHKSRHDQLDEAMAVLGARLVVGIELLPKLRADRSPTAV